MAIPAQPGWLMVWTETTNYDGREIKSVREDRVLAWSDEGAEALVMTRDGPKWKSTTLYDDERYFAYGTLGQPAGVMPAPAGMVGWLKDDNSAHPVAFLGFGSDTLYAYAVSNDAECGGTATLSSGYGFFNVEVQPDDPASE